MCAKVYGDGGRDRRIAEAGEDDSVLDEADSVGAPRDDEALRVEAWEEGSRLDVQDVQAVDEASILFAEADSSPGCEDDAHFIAAVALSVEDDVVVLHARRPDEAVDARHGEGEA